jgi:nickel-dependent lactate racemase
MPGMAGLTTILRNHDAEMIGHPRATWGVTWTNPIWEEVREVALMAGRSFLLNVALNRRKEITGVFAGNLDQAHQQGCEFVRGSAMAPVHQPFDIVITTNSGYPLDMNLYQTVKGMSAAAQVVSRGGAIIVASECSEGIPDHGLYRQLLAEAKSPSELLARILTPGFLAQDQWEAQMQAQIQLQARVFLHSDRLSHDQIRDALLEPCDDIAATVLRLSAEMGGRPRIGVLPEGPQTAPYLA